MGGAAALETGVRLRLGGLDRRATALRGCFGQLLGWPPARRVVTVDYPEEDGLRADLGGGLYDGAPRELRVPLHFADAGGRPGEALALLEGLAAGRPGLAQLEAPGVGYEGRCAVLGVGGVARGARGAWGELLAAYGSMWRWLAGREAPADIQTPWARYEGARYVSQRVLLVAGGPPRVRFEVVLAARRAARL